MNVCREGKGIWFLAEAAAGEWAALEEEQDALRLQISVC